MHISTLLVVRDSDSSTVSEHLRATPHTVVVDAAITSPSALIENIAEFHPDVVILDPSIDEGTTLGEWKGLFGMYPLLICWAPDNTYALEAFRAGALHYITPGNERSEFNHAIQRCAAQLIRYDRGDTNGTTANERRPTFSSNLVALPSAMGIDMRAPDEFMSAHGEGNYTRVVLREDPPMILSKTLGELEPHLERAGMMRVHRSHMVNIDYIRHVKRGKSPVVHLSNGEEVDVSESYRAELFDLLRVQISRRQDQA